MSLLAAIALAASGVTVPTCSWDHPGVNPFMGDVVAAVDRYTDIPAATRAKLKARMEKRDYDEIALIKRDDITGLAQYGSDIRDMHFGQGSVCKTVTRAKWTPTMQERGLVYCEDGQCILVPTVCRNVSRITRLAERPLVIAPGAGVPAGSTPAPAAPVTPETPLDMDAPGAGILGGGAPASPGSFSALPPLDGGVSPTPGGGGPISNPGGGLGPTASPPSIPLLPPTSTPTDVTPPPAVPEPDTWMLFLAGAGAIAAVIRRRR
ncbi:MAG TPA: MHFG family PEP-CTERM protein [Burkholderiaceae bacterium]|jgi:hypothetical protein